LTRHWSRSSRRCSIAGTTPVRETSAAGERPSSLRTRLLLLVMRPTPPPVALGIVVAAGFIAVETVVVVLLHKLTAEAGAGVAYLLGVLVVSTVCGLGLAVTTSVASAIAFAYFRTWPPNALWPLESDDLMVIAVFLVVALLANSLAGLARARAVALQGSRDRLRALAEQQAALRRVATLVGRGASPSEVFATVAEEMARSLKADNALVCRYEPDGTGVVVATARVEHGKENNLVVGERSTPEDGETVTLKVWRTGRAARMDRADYAAATASPREREIGVRSGVGVPIVVDGRLWGLVGVGSSRPLPTDIEPRISDFADLVATAIANAATRAELIASRARIVAAADDARRRLERDLHDGAQQRLVSLGLEMSMAESSVPAELDDLKQQLSRIMSAVTDVSHDLREISHGIHPAIVSKGGLGPALKTLARRCTVPVTVDVAINRRLPDSIEVAAYYVVAEALTNASKHAQASEVNVSARVHGTELHLSIHDDGIGGAKSGQGSGLIGLKDRVEALGGQLHVTSPPGSGTSLNASIPLHVS
jgi:signal transduction histidine kinase